MGWISKATSGPAAQEGEVATEGERVSEPVPRDTSEAAGHPPTDSDSSAEAPGSLPV